MKDIEVTGVQDGALAYVKRDGSGGGSLKEAIVGNDRITPDHQGGLLVEAVDGSGYSTVLPENVEDYLRRVQITAMEQISQ